MGEPSILIPIVAVPEDPHMVMNVEGVRIAMHGDAGWTWDSGWTNKSFWLGAGSGESNLEFNMPTAVIDQMQQSHAQATVELAYVAYRLTREQKIDTSHRYFVIPDVGQCIWGKGRGIIFNSSGLNCVAPLRLPGILVARRQASLCVASVRTPASPAIGFAAAVLFGNDDTRVDFDIDPVRSLQLNFGFWLPLVPAQKSGYRQAELCRGTPITVLTGHTEGRMQARFELGAVGKQVTPDTGGDEGSDD
ncbi:MAG TPA: hypothetical protein VN151_12700 [Terracidiphilus sp.]|nr:hypothetical protein [Terracidiphilus sp.]